MLTQAWVNGIAIAVVAGGLVNAWLALHARPKKSAKPESAKPDKTDPPAPAEKAPPPGKQMIRDKAQRHWTVHRNEAEIARRRAARSDESTGSEQARSGTGEH